MNPAIICLGRYGDILNALPIAEQKSKLWGEKPKFVTSTQFWEILECASYVHPIVWELDYKELPRAIKTARRVTAKDPIVCQAYMHPDQRHLTDSYQTESWRVAGELGSFKGRKLNLDIKRWNGPKLDKDTVLVCDGGVSSPFSLDGVARRLKDKGVKVVTTKEIGMLPKVYDIMSAIESCGCVIASDTMHLHLTGASKTPLIAVINNGWFGSVPPSNAILTQRYESVDESEIVAKAIETIK